MDFGFSLWVILKINCPRNFDWELFEKIKFFSIWGLLKTFFDLKKLYLASETLTLGGHTSKTFFFGPG